MINLNSLDPVILIFSKNNNPFRKYCEKPILGQKKDETEFSYKISTKHVNGLVALLVKIIKD